MSSNNVKRWRQSYFYYTVLNDLRNAVLDDENCDGQDDVKSECLWRLYERVAVEAGGEAPQGPGWPGPRLAPHQAEAAAQPPHRGGRPQLLRHQPRPGRVLVLLQQRRRRPVVYVQNHDWRLRVRERCILLYMIVGGLGVESVLFREFSRLNLDTRM